MKLGTFTGTFNGMFKSIKFEDSNIILVKGDNALQFLYEIECLLAIDLTKQYGENDYLYCQPYKEIEGVVKLQFDTGAMIGAKDRVIIEGVSPHIHCIRYLGKDSFRSFLVTDDVSCSKIGSSLTRKNHILSDVEWHRLILLTNRVVGFELVALKGDELCFSFIEDESCGITVEMQKLVYLLLSDCSLSIDDYERIVLIPDMFGISKEICIRLFQAICGLKNHGVLLTGVDLQVEDLGRSVGVTKISV